jgi:hypothetical protein
MNTYKKQGEGYTTVVVQTGRIPDRVDAEYS